MVDSNAEIPGEEPKQEQDEPKQERVEKLTRKGRDKSISKTRRIAAALATAGALAVPAPSVVNYPATELGPIKATTSLASLESETYDPKAFDMSQQHLPLRDNGEVKTQLGTLPIEGLEVKVDPSNITVPKDRVVKITMIDREPKGNEDISQEWQVGDSAIIGHDSSGQVISKGALNINTFGEGGEVFDNKPAALDISGSEDEAVAVEEFDAKTGSEISGKAYKEDLDLIQTKNGTIVSEVSVPDTFNDEISETVGLFKPYLKKDLRFIMHNTKLSYNQKQAVGHAVLTALEAFQSVNPDKQSMQKLLPKLPSVLKTMAADPANGYKVDEYNALLKNLS